VKVGVVSDTSDRAGAYVRSLHISLMQRGAGRPRPGVLLWTQRRWDRFGGDVLATSAILLCRRKTRPRAAGSTFKSDQARTFSLCAFASDAT
jgi:hypothetical protein